MKNRHLSMTDCARSHVEACTRVAWFLFECLEREHLLNLKAWYRTSPGMACWWLPRGAFADGAAPPRGPLPTEPRGSSTSASRASTGRPPPTRVAPSGAAPSGAAPSGAAPSGAAPSRAAPRRGAPSGVPGARDAAKARPPAEALTA